MGTVLKRFKSSVNETMKRKKHQQKPTAEGRPTVGRKAMRKPRSDEQEPHTRPAWLGHTGGASWHNTAKPTGLVMAVNGAVVRERTAFLPGEISVLCGRESGSAIGSNAGGRGREVSRGHSTEKMNRGAERCPIKQRNSQAQLRKDQTNIGEPTGAPFRNSNHRTVP